MSKKKKIVGLQSLKKWKKIAKENKIVICDGSNYDFTTWLHRAN